MIYVTPSMNKYGVCSRCGKDYSKEGSNVGNDEKFLVGIEWVLKFRDAELKKHPLIPVQYSEIYFLCDDCIRALHDFMKGEGLNESDS